MARLEWIFEFPARFEVIEHDRVPPAFAETRVFGYPDAIELRAPLRLPVTPVLEIKPARGEPWVGVFEGKAHGWGRDDFGPPYLIGWPDEESLCVVWSGLGTLVKSSDPRSCAEIECWPIKDLLVVPDAGVVVFADHTDLVAYGADGGRWKTEKLVADDLRIVGADAGTLVASGFVAGSRNVERRIDLETGEIARDWISEARGDRSPRPPRS